MEMEDLAVCCLENQHFSETRGACLFAARNVAVRLTTKDLDNSPRIYVDYTTVHFLCMKGTNDSI